MTWPTAPVSTTNTDASSDSPANARADILDLQQKVNEMIAVEPVGRLIGVRVFSTPGASVYTPTVGTKSVLVECVGGGGGGVGMPSVSSGYRTGGSGGWGGSYAKSYLTSGFAGVTVTVGSGGAGGPSTGGNGLVGGTSSFGSVMTCPGGSASLYLSPTNATNEAQGPQGPMTAPTGGNIVQIHGAPGGKLMILNGIPFTTPGGSSQLGSWDWDATMQTGFGAGSPAIFQTYGYAARAGLPGGNGAVIIYEFS